MGTLTINRRQIIVRSNSASQYYNESNPTELRAYGGKVIEDESLGQLGLVYGHGANINCTGSQTNIGVSENKFTVIIIDTDTGDTVTDNYQIIKEFGTLQVFPPQ